MDDPAIPVSALLEQADLEPFDPADLEGATVVDALVIFRYQHPDWPSPRAAYVGSTSMGDELRIGILTMVNDRIRSVAASHWVDDE